MDAGPAEDPSATFRHGRGPDGYTASVEASMGPAGRTATGLTARMVTGTTTLTPVLGSPGFHDGGGPIRATATTFPTLHLLTQAQSLKGWRQRRRP